MCERLWVTLFNTIHRLQPVGGPGFLPYLT
jgi:hypothetical protein